MATKTAVLISGYAPAETKTALAQGLARRFASAAGATLADTTSVSSPLAAGGFDVKVDQVFDGAEEKALLRKHFGAVILAVDDADGVAIRRDHVYHVRVLSVCGATVDDLVAAAWEALAEPPMKHFLSTRRSRSDVSTKPVGFLRAVKQGLAPDGGLYLPVQLASPFPRHVLEFVSTAPVAADYAVVAQIILERLVNNNEVPPGVLHTMISRAYDVAAWSGETRRCPTADVTFPEAKQNGSDARVFLSQQYFGPTSAFKDFALQLFPQWFDLATTVEEQREATAHGEDPADVADADGGSRYLILTATSGDTGGAAINGFVRGAPHVKMMVLYPTKGVSPVQRLQMLSMNGDNVRVVAVDGDFDYCQSTVKRIFGDKEIENRLGRECQTRLSSANSINWGRLLPQLVYYFANYGDLVRQGVLKFGEPMDVVVPTGNFGNILACYIAKQLGLPVNRFVLASNNNDVLHEFVQTGVYDISHRKLDLTASPSIDILKASNVERFLHLATGGDGDAVKSMMDQLASTGRFEAPESVRAVLRGQFRSGRCDEATCRQSIKRVYEESRIVIDPHTAVAMDVARQYIVAASSGEATSAAVLVASTAHWAKFPEPVAEAFNAVPEGGLKGNAASANDIRTLFQQVVKACPEASVSAPLAKIFESVNLAESGARLPAEFEPIVKELFDFASIGKHGDKQTE